MPEFNDYFETCDLCEKDDFSIRDCEIAIKNDKSRPANKTLTFLCFGCSVKLQNMNYLEF